MNQTPSNTTQFVAYLGVLRRYKARWIVPTVVRTYLALTYVLFRSPTI